MATVIVSSCRSIAVTVRVGAMAMASETDSTSPQSSGAGPIFVPAENTPPAGDEETEQKDFVERSYIVATPSFTHGT